MPAPVSQPELNKNYARAHPSPGDEICITGISGAFPSSDTVAELRDNLLANKNLINYAHGRWEDVNEEIPYGMGTISGIDRLDAGYFGLHPWQAHCMDPVARVAMEKVHEAVFDAGINPKTLKGQKVGIFNGSSLTEAEKLWFFDDKVEPVALTGCTRAMIANRASYSLKVAGGASCTIDTACSSSITALEHAYRAMRGGEYDMTIVGGCNICILPTVTLHFARLGVLTYDGLCKPFDNCADGYVRSEAICFMVLQKKKFAKRIYGEIMHVRTNSDGFKEQGLTFPSSSMQKALLRTVYNDLDLDPAKVWYVEAHGTGTKVGDPEELNALDEALCSDRKGKPLWVGSVKSNLGHSEASSALCSVAKMLFAFETGIMPATINLRVQRAEVAGLRDQRIKIMLENSPIEAGPVGVSSFGFGGANGHVVLKRHDKEKQNFGLPADDLPRLVCFSARTEEGVQALLQDLTSRPLDAEHVGLLHSIFEQEVPGFIHRAFALLDKTRGLVASGQKLIEDPPGPLIFVLPGNGDSWSSLMKNLQVLPVFKDSLDRLQKALGFAQNRNQTLVAVQIVLLDVLKDLGVQPEFYAGQGLGELTCAYLDGCLSRKEAVLSALEQKNKLFKRSQRWISLKQGPSEELDCSKIPKGAIVVEISAENLFGGALKALGNQLSESFCLMRSGRGLDSFLEGLGMLHITTCRTILTSSLYPSIQFPVSRGTPMISPHFRWLHYQSWIIPKYEVSEEGKACQRVLSISSSNSYEMSFIEGHIIDGRTIIPAAGYLRIVWETLATMAMCTRSEMDIVLERVRFVRTTNMQKGDKVAIQIVLHRISGRFELSEGGVDVCTGFVRLPEDVYAEMTHLPELQVGADEPHMLKRDVYKELRLRGYNYAGAFKSILRCTLDGRVGEAEWQDNIVVLMDNMLQLKLMTLPTRDLFIPTEIEKVVINTKMHQEALKKFNNEKLIMYSYPELKTVKCGGVELKGIQGSIINRRKPLGVPVLESCIFVPNKAHSRSFPETLRVCLQAMLETSPKLQVKTLEILQTGVEPIGGLVREILGDLPLIRSEITSVEDSEDLNANQIDLILGSDLLGRKTIDSALTCMSPTGFVISRQKASEPLNVPTVLQVLIDHQVNEERVLLMNLRAQYLVPEVVDVSDDQSFVWIPQVQAIMADPKHNLLLHTRNQNSGILGLVNCIRKEPAVDQLRAMFIMDQKAPPLDLENPFYQDQLKKQMALNVFKDGQWGTYRHLLIPEGMQKELFHGFVTFTNNGDLSSSRMVGGEFRKEDWDNEEFLMIHYSSINFRDIMVATNRISKDVMNKEPVPDASVGFEFAGITNKGRRVAGLRGINCISNLVQYSPLCLTLPKSMSLKEGATIPIVYGTVIKAYESVPSKRPGQKILIHAGSGGVGMAAIHLARLNKWEVFTTAGTPEKRKYLQKVFPFIQDDHIGNSRDCSFEHMILTMTEGKGVDMVLNSLSEDKLVASLRCLRPGGTFLEIGKFDMMNNTSIALRDFMPISFCSIMLDTYFWADPEQQRELADKIQAMLDQDLLMPLPTTVFKLDQVEEAFRYMAMGKHTGKVLIEIREEDPGAKIPHHLPVRGSPRFYCSQKKSYVILGGLGGFGMELANWLINRYARKVVLTSRVGVKSGYQKSMLSKWRALGADVRVSTANIATQAGVEQILLEASQMGPIESIFNLAVVLKDGLFQNQTPDSFRESFQSKAVATRVLDEASRKLCPDLRHFVVFSSVSCGRGNAGQSNYGMSNSVMERICEQRRSCGLPALAIEWGAVGDVGLVAEMQEDHTELEISGTLQQRISSCLEVLDDLLESPEPLVSSMVVAEKRLHGADGSIGIVEMVANVLGLRDLKSISLENTLAELGLDSIMVVEVKQLLEAHLDLNITLQDVRSITFGRIKALEAQRSLGIGESTITTEEIIHQFWDEVNSRFSIVEMKRTKPEDGTVFLIPGVEGMAVAYQQLARALPLNVVCLQLTADLVGSVQEYAAELYKRLTSVYQIQPGFTLIGFSFGVAVAIELTILLEKDGLIGRLMAIDGSPLQTNKTAENLGVADPELYTNNIVHMILGCFFKAGHEIYDLVSRENGYENKLALALDTIETATSLSPLYLKTCASLLFGRGQLSQTYAPSRRHLLSSVHLVVPLVPTLQGLPTDLGLGQMVPEGQLEPITVPDCNHRTILNHPMVHQVVAEIAKSTASCRPRVDLETVKGLKTYSL